MTNVDIAMGLLLKKLDIRMDSLDDRIIAQKKFYLLQEMGTGLGFSYNWYVHGPYSPELTKYIYDFGDPESKQDLSVHRLTEKAIHDCNIINGIATDDRLDLDPKEKYELLASILFWVRNIIPRSDNIESVINKVRSHKPRFSFETCQNAYNLLVEDGILKHEG